MLFKWTKRRNHKSSDRSGSHPISFSSDLNQNIAILKSIFVTDDIVFEHTYYKNTKGCFVFLSEMVNEDSLLDLQQGFSSFNMQSEDLNRQEESLMTYVRQRFPLSKIKNMEDSESVINEILLGKTVLFIDHLHQFIIFNTVGTKGRSIQEPITEQVVRGPRDGFVEDLQVNLMLIRKRIKTPSLRIEYIIVGKKSQTKIAIVYMDGIADGEIVSEVRKRIKRIEIDGILESNYIEENIQDNPYSPFPTLNNTERPDRTCASLLEGKVAILTDGTPFVLTVPALFAEFLHVNEDYYESSLVFSTMRWIRALGLLIGAILPAFYIAITTFHQDLLQTPFLVRIAGYREDLPYPVLVEALFMQLTFEIVREAGLRLPKVVGNAVTFVGTLVIGQAAVEAGLIGALMVIVISITALTSFILPNYAYVQILRLISFPMLFFAGTFGFLGILVGLMGLLAHLTSLRSFGVPYMSPISPARSEGWKDVFLRAPIWAMETRQPGLGVEDLSRADSDDPPRPPKTPEEK
jgi:hypothetical protein